MACATSFTTVRLVSAPQPLRLLSKTLGSNDVGGVDLASPAIEDRAQITYAAMRIT